MKKYGLNYIIISDSYKINDMQWNFEMDCVQIDDKAGKLHLANQNDGLPEN